MIYLTKNKTDSNKTNICKMQPSSAHNMSVLKSMAEFGLKIIDPFLHKETSILFFLFYKNYEQSYSVFVDMIPRFRYDSVEYFEFIADLILELTYNCFEGEPVYPFMEYLLRNSTTSNLDSVASILASYIQKIKINIYEPDIHTFDRECPICYQENKYMTGPRMWNFYGTECRCNQLICSECITDLMERNYRCPFCRQDIYGWYRSVRGICDYL